MRIVARGFGPTVIPDAAFGGTLKFTKLRGFLTIAAIHGTPVAFGDRHCAFLSITDAERIRIGVCRASA